MPSYPVSVSPGPAELPREGQLAWRLAEVALDPVPVTDAAATIAVDRMIDNAAVAMAALGRAPVRAARAASQAHPASSASPGSAVFGAALARRVSPEWAAWANGVAVRELDFHDTFLAQEYAHPADCIPALLAVAQHCACDGAALTRAIVASYEIHVDLARAISLHEHGIDHVAHLAPAVAGGLGALLGLDAAATSQAIAQSLHTTTATRQSRSGEISSWKAYAPAWAAMAAIIAVDRAMRGESSPAPIYEGRQGVIATLLDGPEGRYDVWLPAPGEPKAAIEQTYTKEYSAEYQAQAFIDLARALRAQYPQLQDPEQVESLIIHTSHHTHTVIGSGSGDPQKYSPDASRETLDHSLPYIVAVALQDGRWHHEASYDPQRTHRPDTVALWQLIRTDEDPVWTQAYHHPDPAQRSFGGQIVAQLRDGTEVQASLAVADAHPRGARPFTRERYLAKLEELAGPVAAPGEVARFAALAQDLPALSPGAVRELTLVALPEAMGLPSSKGIF